jgi:hypothetical protein
VKSSGDVLAFSAQPVEAVGGVGGFFGDDIDIF